MSANKEKQRVSAWLYPETIDRIKDLYRMDDCRNRSEFIEKAIRFYIGLPYGRRQNKLFTEYIFVKYEKPCCGK